MGSTIIPLGCIRLVHGHLNELHHTVILVEEDVTVEHELARKCPDLHPEFYAAVLKIVVTRLQLRIFQPRHIHDEALYLCRSIKKRLGFMSKRTHR